jgi:SAM-dependent methyltransferase
MDPSLLPRPGIILNHDKDYLRTIPRMSFKGLKVLCIGYSEAEIDCYVAPLGPSCIQALTLWDGHQDSRVTKYPLVIGDITQRTEFSAESFDAVLTLSLIEHLTPLSGAVDEIWRLLRPTGYFCATWGPAWSSPYGHHVYAKPGDPLLDFTSWQMPAHVHLLCSPREIAQLYSEAGYSDEDVRIAWHWFFEAPHINRLCYEDCMQIVSERFQLAFEHRMYNPLPPEHLQTLRRRFPRYHDFSTYGANAIWRKCW